MKASILPVANGPLKLTASTVAVTQNDQPVEMTLPAFLCRCGLSANKPYCDGAHSKHGFTSEKEISKEVIQHYIGNQVSISFNRSICSGAARCVSALPSAFRSDSSDNWIHPDQADVTDIEEVVRSCPSGALSMSMNGESLATPDSALAAIEIVKNGPLNVKH